MKVQLVKDMLNSVMADAETVIGSELKEKKKALRKLLKRDKLKGKHLRRIASLSKSVANLSEELSLTRQRHHFAVESLKKPVTFYVKLKKKVVDTVEVDLENLSIEAGFEDHLQALVHSDPLINSKGFPPGVRFASIARGPETPTSLKSFLQDAGFKPFEGTATVSLANEGHLEGKVKKATDLVLCEIKCIGRGEGGELIEEVSNEQIVCKDSESAISQKVCERMFSWFLAYRTEPVCEVRVYKLGTKKVKVLTYKYLNGRLNVVNERTEG